MSLIDAGANAYRYESGVEFGMSDHNKAVVRVRVSDTALDDLEPKTRRGSDYVGIFDRHRTRIADVASKKFNAGQLEPGGIVLVLTRDLSR
jgi:uncharacterized protein DUF1488